MEGGIYLGLRCTTKRTKDSYPVQEQRYIWEGMKSYVLIFFIFMDGSCFVLMHKRDGVLQTTLGRVTIQIDKVVTEGLYSGFFSLDHDGNKDGSSRTLEIDILWSNRMSNESL